MKIAVCNRGHVVNGLFSCLTTETRVMVNIAMMLSSFGHEVDLVNYATYVENSTSKDLFPELNVVSVDSHNHSKEYDVCFVDIELSSFTKDINAEVYFSVTYLTPGDWLIGVGLKQKKEVDEQGKKYVLGVLYERWIDNVYLWDTDQTLKDVLVFFPQPTYTKDYTHGWQCSELTWTTKHVYTGTGPRQELVKVTQNVLGAFSRYKDLYKFNFLFESGALVTQFPNKEILGNGVFYDKILDYLARSKLAITSYYAGSYLEAGLHGCIPMIWDTRCEGEKGGAPYLRKAREFGLVFNIDDSVETIESKIISLLEDESFYNKVYDAFYEVSDKHSFSSAHSHFIDIMEKIN